MHKKRNKADELAVLRQAVRCICGASRASTKQITSLDDTEIGLICLKCGRFALGDTLADSTANWNKKQATY